MKFQDSISWLIQNYGSLHIEGNDGELVRVTVWREDGLEVSSTKTSLALAVKHLHLALAVLQAAEVEH